MSEKRYFWLKLQQDFFDTEAIQYIEEQPNGYLYSNIYLKLLLKSIQGNGTLIRHIGTQLIPYDPKSLAKMTGHSADTIKVAMDMLVKLGLVQMMDTGEIYMTQLQQMVGSEAASTIRSRKCREQKKALQCNVTATPKQLETVAEPSPDRCATGKNATLEYRDKSIEIRVKNTKVSGHLAEPCARIISYLNEKANRDFKPTSKATQRLISARLQEKHSENDFYTVIDKKVAEWSGDPKMEGFLRPETLFSAKHFESYLQQPWPTSQTKAGGAGYAFENTAWDDVEDVGEVNF